MAINIRSNKNNVQGNVIAVDQLLESVRFCSSGDENESLTIDSAKYKVRPFDKDFYDRLSKIIKQHKEKNPDSDLQKASIILPDQLFMLDMVTIPMIHRKAMQHSLSLAIENIYKNASEMNLMTYGIGQTKQTATYGLVGIRWNVLEEVRKTFTENGINVSGITYATNATVNGAMAMNQKLRNETFMLMDIKEECTRFALVVRGCTMGYFDLPFGYSIMYKSRLASEDTLFDHRAGELLVLNAKERARAKQLTMEGIEDEAGEEDEVFEEGSAQRNGRKLPKFMQRPTPTTREEYIYENFRIFLKWALDLLTSNREIVNLAKMDTVYVNMPDEYRFLFDVVAKKHEGREVKFVPLLSEGEDTVISANLELYGGYFLNKFNEANTF